MTDAYRELRNGRHLIKQAKASGWKEDDAEGPFNFIVRQAYELGQRDLQPEIDRLRNDLGTPMDGWDHAAARIGRAAMRRMVELGLIDDTTDDEEFIIGEIEKLGLKSEVEELAKQRDEADAQANRALELAERAALVTLTERAELEAMRTQATGALNAVLAERKRGQDMHRRAQKAEGILRKMRNAHASSYYASIEHMARDYMSYGWQMLLGHASLFPRLPHRATATERREVREHFAKTGEIKLD